MNKPTTIGEILDLIKEQLQQSNQLDLKATEFQLVASPENTKLEGGGPVLFMGGGDPFQLAKLTMAATIEAFKQHHNEEDTIEYLRRLLVGIAETFLFVGETSFDDHCGHDINRIAAEVFKKHSTHTPQNEAADDFDALLQQTLDSLNLDKPATRSTLDSLYGDLGIIYNATRTKQ